MKTIVWLWIFVAIFVSSSQAELMWIWKQGTVKTEKAEFRKVFQLEKIPRKAALKITCDNQYTLTINGKEVGKSGDWAEMLAKDVSKLLKKGENEIFVHAANEGSMGGLLFELKMKDLSITSDHSWQARMPNKEWQSAVEIAKYGEDPWGEVFKIKPTGATAAAELQLPEGFRAELLYSVPKEEQGSWVGMTVDDKGRLITCDQFGGFFRVDVTKKCAVEKLVIDIEGAHGVLYAFDSLYVMVNDHHERGLYRFQDSNGDGQFDKKEILKLFHTGGEHGVHSMVLSPDGQSIYLVMGNAYSSSRIAELDKSRLANAWGDDLLLARLWDPRGFGKGQTPPGGAIIKTDKDGREFELISTGYRNQFDAAFNLEGELFTYDSDMELDFGSPWYRPTRVNHVVSGSDYGWRSGSGKWPEYYPDSLPATLNIGPGSPTGVSSGKGAAFPEKYQRAIYLNDWSYGTMYALHLEPLGASYSAVKEEFLSGIPLPLTDVIIHPTDGHMYFMIGGRRTQSGLYRVSYTGSESTAPAQPKAITVEAKLRGELEQYHLDGLGIEAIEKAWPHLAHSDRFIRYAARVAIEKQAVELWKNKVFSETQPLAVVESVIALARMSKDPEHQSAMIDKLGSLDFVAMDKAQKLATLRAYQLVFTRTGTPQAGVKDKVVATFNSSFPAQDKQLNIELAQVLLYLGAPKATPRAVQLLVTLQDDHRDIASTELLNRSQQYGGRAKAWQQSRPNTTQIAMALALHNVKSGWTPELYQTFFSWFPRAKSWNGGYSLSGYIENMRTTALANVEDETLRTKLDEISSKTPSSTREITAPEGPGQMWTVDSALKAVEGNLRGRNFAKGENLFHASACASCHQFNGEGGDMGPDLTRARNRYTLKDLLENIIEPSKVISDQYGSEVITKNDGSQIIGKVGAEENGILYVMTNPYATDLMIEVKVADIADRKAWPISSMPQGLTYALNKDELSDLVAFILSAGNKSEKYFAKVTELFDGRTLNGWDGDPKLWSVENGAIVGSTHGVEMKGNTFLIWKGAELENFELSYDCKVEGSNNSGMMYRAQRLEPEKWRLRGNQADIHPKAEYCAMLYSEGTGRGVVAQRGTAVVVDAATGKPSVVGKTMPATKVDIAQWNSYKIVAEGKRLRHYVNGRLAIDLEDNHQKISLKGLIGMQLHVGKPMKASFKNIVLTEK